MPWINAVSRIDGADADFQEAFRRNAMVTLQLIEDRVPRYAL
jgi:hypothetical protein